MKNLSWLLGATFLLLLGACSTPADYYTAITKETAKVEKETLNIATLLKERNIEEAQHAFEKGKKQTSKSLKKLEQMSVFRDNDALRQAAIEFVAFYDGLFNNEYQKAFDLLKREGSYTAEEADLLYEMMSIISILGTEVRRHLHDEQLAFIKEYGLIVSKKP